jgi:hypothetical protein
MMLADEDHPVEDAAAAQVDEPQVMVVYRRQGVPWVLVPPLMLISAVSGAIGYRKTVGHERPIVIAQVSPAEDAPKVIPREEPAPVVTPPPASQEKAAPVVLPEEKPVPTPAPLAVVAVQPPPAPVAPEPATAPAGESKPAPVASPFDVLETRPATPEEPAKRAAVGFDPDAAKVTLAPTPTPADGPVLGDGRPGEGVMKPKTDEVFSEFQQEAEARMAERLRLEAAKPGLLQGNPRETRERVREMIAEARRESERQRMPFHADLRRVLAERGYQGGRDIQELFDTYGGRDCLPEIMKEVNRDLVGPAARLTQQARVERMRRWGLPEQLILEDLVEREKTNANGRNGPRNPDQAWVIAARMLLTMPPKDRRVAPPAARTVGTTPPGGQ